MQDTSSHSSPLERKRGEKGAIKDPETRPAPRYYRKPWEESPGYRDKFNPDAAFRAIKSAIDKIPEELHPDLRFECNMFLSRLELLASRAKIEDFEKSLDRAAIRGNLFEFLRDDMVFFLLKVLNARDKLPAGFPDTTPITRAVVATLKELNIFVLYPAGKDYSRTSILERWYGAVLERELLTLKKLVNYFNLYKSRLYSLAEVPPVAFADIPSLTRRMLSDEQYEIGFEEIYTAENDLRNEILFSLLRQVSPTRRLEYLIQKAMITDISDEFIKTLHREYYEYLREKLAEHEIAREEILAQKETMDTELRIAESLHRKNLQRRMPEGDERIKFSLWHEPFMAVSGDYYRVVRIDDDEYALLQADITGHGIGAAMYINTVRLSFEGKQSYLDKPAKMLRKMNEELYAQLGDNFVTAIYVYVNLKKKIIKYCNAGHTKGFLYDKQARGRRIRFLRPNSKILGVFRKGDFREATMRFRGDHRLVLYTDGLSEAVNEKEELLGERRLLDMFLDTDHLSLDKTMEHVRGLVDKYRGTAPVEDDRCMILTEIRAPGE